MHAIILAGGFGTRLRSVVSDVPKPLAPIGQKPFLAWLIEVLAHQSVTSVTLSVHHQWEKIRDYFEANPAPIPLDYAVEDKPLGTGGAIVFALAQHKADQPVLVLNGDSFVRADYRALYDEHVKSGAKLSVTLREVPDTSRYGAVGVEGGIITSFTSGAADAPGLINAGVYVMSPNLFTENDLPEAFSFEQDFLPPRLAVIKPKAFRADNYFIDIGVPDDYARACLELPKMLM